MTTYILSAMIHNDIIFCNEDANGTSREWPIEGTPMTDEERLVPYKRTIDLMLIFSVCDRCTNKVFSSERRFVNLSEQCYL